MSDPHAIEIKTEGQRLLLLAHATLKQIGDRVGATKVAVHSWKHGKSIPTVEFRAKLSHAYKIPVDSWTKCVDGSPATPRKSGRKPRERVDPAFPTVDAVDVDVLPTAYAGCLQLLGTISAARRDERISVAERIRLADSEARILKLRAQLEERAELAEDRYVREHPAWHRVKRELIHVLVKYPDAARAVAEALERLDM